MVGLPLQGLSKDAFPSFVRQIDRTLDQMACICPGPDSAHIPKQKNAKTEGRKYFLKLIGPGKVVKANREAFVKMIKSLED